MASDYKVMLDLVAHEATWLSVSSDGKPVFSGILQANQTKTVGGKQFAKMRVGNAAGIEVRLNGKLARTAGSARASVDRAVHARQFPDLLSAQRERLNCAPCGSVGIYCAWPIFSVSACACMRIIRLRWRSIRNSCWRRRCLMESSTLRQNLRKY